MHLGRVIEHFSGITGTLANQDELTSGDMFCEVMRNAFAFAELDQQMIDLGLNVPHHYPTREDLIQRLYFGGTPYEGFDP